MGHPEDIEAQHRDSNSDDGAERGSSGSLANPSGVVVDHSEYAVSAGTKWAYLAAYFACNVALTLYNKSILAGQLFPYPWLLTAIHAGSASLGCYVLELRGAVRRTELSRRDERVLLGFSVLFTMNIAVSNVSLYVPTSQACPFYHISC